MKHISLFLLLNNYFLIKALSFKMFFCIFLSWGYTWSCSGLILGSDLRVHYWGGWNTIWDAGNRSQGSHIQVKCLIHSRSLCVCTFEITGVYDSFLYLDPILIVHKLYKESTSEMIIESDTVVIVKIFV